MDQTNTLRSKIIQSQTILLVGLNHLVYFANHRVTFQGKTKTIPCGIESYNNIQYCYWGQTIMSICPVSMREQGGQGAMCSCLSQCLHLAICSVSGCWVIGSTSDLTSTLLLFNSLLGWLIGSTLDIHPTLILVHYNSEYFVHSFNILLLENSLKKWGRDWPLLSINFTQNHRKFEETRPWPAFGRPGLEWIIGWWPVRDL